MSLVVLPAARAVRRRRFISAGAVRRVARMGRAALEAVVITGALWVFLRGIGCI